MNNARTYHSLDVATGYPAGESMFYECLRCGDVVPSLPDDSMCCRCRNIMIDVDYGRIRIEDPGRARLFSES